MRGAKKKPWRNSKSLGPASAKPRKKELVMNRNWKLEIAPVATTFSLLLAGFVALAPSSTTAQPVFDGSKARVNLAGKLRSLTQQVASASCRMNAQIDVEDAREDLRLSLADIATIIDGLENGNLTLGIPSAERNRRPLKALRTVRETWLQVRAAAENFLANRGTAADLDVIAKTNAALLEATIVLSTEISGQYSNPLELLQSDAMAIGIAGRQSMLAHQISTTVCGMATDTANLGNAQDLSQAIEIFQRSLVALRDGLPDAGINPPPNEAILNELTAIYTYWDANRANLLSLTSVDTIAAQNVAATARMADNLMVDMENVVTLYMLSTPGQEDVYRIPLQAYAERELSQWLKNPLLIAAIKQQNDAHASLSQDAIDNLDLEWRAEAKVGGGSLISKLLSHPVSEWLREQQTATAGFVTEVFVMDNKGLNVAQSVETSDYWQGDEAKWQKTIGDGSGSLHISEVEFDDSTQFYQSQVSLPIFDPASGDMIGAITFGINVQNLL